MSWREEAKETVASLIEDRGEDGAYTAGGSDPVTIPGIFEEPPVEKFDPGILSAAPAFTVAEDALPGLAKADVDMLTVRGRTFHVRGIQRDGVAAVRLVLEEAD